MALVCSFQEDTKCDRNAKYRTFDGTCNNVKHPLWGSAMMPQIRMLPPKYDDCKCQRYYMSRVMRKSDFCICENKDADQLRDNREADQRLCFRHTNIAIPLLSKSEISNL